MNNPPFGLTHDEANYNDVGLQTQELKRKIFVGGGTVKILLNVLNLTTFVFFCISIVTGIHLEKNMTGLGSHLGWVLGTLLVWMLTMILSMMYMYRMEKFCVEIVEKYDWKKEKEELGG